MLPESCKQLIRTSLHMVDNPPNWHRPEVDKTESEHLEIDQYRFIVFILQNFIRTFASWTCCTSNNFQALAIHPQSVNTLKHRNFYPFCPPPRISWISILPSTFDRVKNQLLPLIWNFFILHLCWILVAIIIPI